MSALNHDRWRPRGPAEGEAEYQQSEQRLAEGPVITVPTITLEGEGNGMSDAQQSPHEAEFSGTYSHRIIAGGIGYNLRPEALEVLAQATVDVDGET